MSASTSTHTIPFLKGGGEMGHLTRTYDWANSPLGPPDTWPRSLRITLSIMLHSAFPMFLFWGDELTCFYNDAYRPSLGNEGKHPAVGQPGKVVWPEIWSFIGPYIEQVMTTGEPVWFEDQLVPIYRNERLEDVYWTFSYSPAFGDEDQIAGMLVTCTETTEKVVNAKLQQEKSELFQAVFDSSSAGISVISSVRNEQGEIIDFDYQLVNRVTEQANNRTELVGKRYSTIHSKYKETGLFDDFKAAIDTGKVIERERHYTGEGFDNWYEIIVVKLGDGVVLSFRDMTTTIHARQKVEESEQHFRRLTDTIPAVIWETRADGYCTYLNEQWYALSGQSPAEAEGFGWLDATHPDDKAEAGRLFMEANARQVSFEARYRLRQKDGSYRWAIDKSNPRFGADGRYLGMIGTVLDVHDQTMAEESLRQSEAKLRSVVETAPVAIGLFMGRDLVIELPNQAFIDIVGKGNDIAGKPLREVMPELTTENQPFLQILDDVYTSGKPFHTYGSQVKIVQHGVMVENYYNITYSPLFDAAGKVYAILDIAVDVTGQVLAQRQIEASEQRFQALIRDADVGIVVLIGEEMTVAIVNEAYSRLIDLTPAELIGKPLFSIIPDAEAYYRPLLNQVRTTGEPLYLSESPYSVRVNGKQIDGFLNVTYQPYREENNTIRGITVLCQDVTEQVLARQKIEEAEASLRGAVELAQLGTWSIDAATNGLTYSDRLIDWFGYDPGAQPYSEVIPILEAGDRERVETAMAWALNPVSNGVYNEIYTVIHPKSGQKRILHAQGKTVFDATGKAVRMNGTAQDITIQRELQLALENEVQLRTRQLQASVHDLERSNQNLQQFAYIASHDLQEPLRKIQSFGDILKSQYASQLGEGVDLLQRMQKAASRMSGLIKDLLAFSRISTRQETSTSVSLEEVVKMVLNDLELVVQETGAVVESSPLPTVKGDPSQLSQLFQNLLSNALKFRRADPSGTLAVPHIRVTTKQVSETDLPPSIKPTREAAAYYCIDVVDNGIGFDQKYADRIFHVFQRLHGRSEFAGTGIGLAICEKVVANHGGAITAVSRPGQGATFSVYLPVV